ncbi:MAG: hypothetical protein HeimC3_02100 [Candidatus Heimdallarchaeota archaeon LC_3]|nr:MAG: hypothetical protein HeimC3_02100 [Candidatus Heimdallarchaeota archaeon LC_3]
MLLNATQTGAASSGYWWLVVSPGACIAALSVAFALIGYTTQQIVNPRLRARAD